jgi:hypothetical protein
MAIRIKTISNDIQGQENAAPIQHHAHQPGKTVHELGQTNKILELEWEALGRKLNKSVGDEGADVARLRRELKDRDEQLRHAESRIAELKRQLNALQGDQRPQGQQQNKEKQPQSQGSRNDRGPQQNHGQQQNKDRQPGRGQPANRRQPASHGQSSNHGQPANRSSQQQQRQQQQRPRQPSQAGAGPQDKPGQQFRMTPGKKYQENRRK